MGELRKTAPSNLSVLTQDILSRSLEQIDRATLADLFALAEIPDQLPGALAKELVLFQGRLAIAIRDLPDGAGLADFANDLAVIPAKLVPSSLREIMLGLVADTKSEDAVQALSELQTQWAAEDSADLVLPDDPAPVKKAAKATKAAAKTPAKKAPAKRKRRTTTVVDERREEWIREDVTSRLVNYGTTGLKEPIVIAGARHRSPWDDLTEAEILVILRRMKREGVLRFSAGRWSMNR